MKRAGGVKKNDFAKKYTPLALLDEHFKLSYVKFHTKIK